MKCPKCDSEVHYSYDKCPTCGHYIGPPNVRAIETQEEIQALQARYEKAFVDAKSNGSYAILNKFDEAMKDTCAVMNVDFDFLKHFLTKDNALYSTYSHLLSGQTRKPASTKDDRHRLAVEAIIFGAYGKEIRYAALSLNGTGVKSYGAYTMKLKEVAIAERTTLLEENSFQFVAKHDMRPGDDIPRGYRALWPDRHKLAVSKLYQKVTPQTSENEFAKILLFSEGNRSTDEFVEVYIYGSFDNKAVDSVSGKFTATKKEKRALLNSLKEIIVKSGAKLLEE